MKSVAIEAQNIVLRAAEPTFPGERVSVQKERAFRKLRLHQVPAGDSKLHNAWNGRAGPATLYVLKEQAKRVGLNEGLDHERRELLDGLRRMAWNAHGATKEALETAIRELERRDA